MHEGLSQEETMCTHGETMCTHGETMCTRGNLACSKSSSKNCTQIKSFQAMCCAVLCLITQLCSTLCNPMDCSLSGSPVYGDSPGKNTGVR